MVLLAMLALLCACGSPDSADGQGPAATGTSALAKAQAEADAGRARLAAAGAEGMAAANAYAVSRGVVKGAGAGADLLGLADENGYADLDWTHMMPPEDIKLLEDAPPVVHVGTQRMKQVGTLHTVAALDGRKVRLTGYVVPLESDAEGRMTEFFFVPFYGACIHVPPPPPNMLVHVRLSKGIDTPSLYDPLVLRGVLHTQQTSNAMAASAYAVDGAALGPYRNDDEERLRQAFD